MAISTVSSSAVKNNVDSTAAPTKSSLPAGGRGLVGVYATTVEVATTSLDEVGDVILLAPLQGNESVISIEIYSDDLDSGTAALTFDLGLYKGVSKAGDSAVVVDVDAYGADVAVGQAASTTDGTATNYAFASRDIALIGQSVALDGGESVHNDWRYLGLTVTTVAATAVAGTISVVIKTIRK